MIKKLQALRAKKGFTLVELIVVIAIIGVLAAILVPTMMGFVTSSRVTSANSTAASFEDQIENFLTECDTAGYGMKLSETATTKITISIASANGVSTWTMGLDTVGSFKTKTGITWEGSTTVKSTDKKIDFTTKPLNLMGISLCALFPDLKSGYVEAYVKGGNVEYVYYTADTNSAVGDMAASYDDKGQLTGPNIDFGTKVANWDQKTAGISSDGYVVGTSPALGLGKKST